MWLTATGILLGSQIDFLQPAHLSNDFDRSIDKTQIEQNDLQSSFDDRSRIARRTSNHSLAIQQDPVATQPLAIDFVPISIEIDKQQRNFYNIINRYSFAERAIFKSGEASWKANTKLGFLNLNGDFSREAHLKKGKAFWQTNTKIGSVNLAIHVDDRLKPLKSVASWQTDSTLGSFAIQGNFNRETTFTGINASWKAKTIIGKLSLKGDFDEQTTFKGGNAAWKADTSLGSLFLQGNFDRDTVFTGGNIKVATKTSIGFLTADFKMDRETRFKGAKASWNTKFILGSNIDISSNFNDTSAFDGGTIRLDKKNHLGNLNLKANLDREINFTDVSINFKFQLP